MNIYHIILPDSPKGKGNWEMYINKNARKRIRIKMKYNKPKINWSIPCI